jgi:hypothetical protein
MATIFSSKDNPKSQIINNSFNQRLSSLFGFRGVSRKNAQNDFERSTGIRFVKVDVANDAFRVKQAALGSIFKNTPLTTTLNKYFNAYINETTLVYSDIRERLQRLNELRFAVLNDPFLGRVCELVAGEATQLDQQNRLLTVDSPSVAFTNKCYELFAQWGITQQRIYSVCYNLQQYGEALWAHRVTERGVERIIPLRVPALKERLEFSAAHMAEVLSQMNGEFEMQKNRGAKIDKLITMLTSQEGGEKINDLNSNFSDVFDTKLLGFEFDDGIIVPPWLITHFRYNADESEFFPYGYPPLLKALAPFKQYFSTMALQGLARASSFPVQLYKVKGTEGANVYQAFDVVNNVREEYDNIGVTPQSNSLEVYTINTKVWIPDGLMDMQIIESKIDYDFTGDLELYQDRVAIACGVPKAYLDQEFGGFGNSGISLIEQYKPFARHVYTIQSSFLEGLGQLIRLHFAITGEFDYNTPFVLSMRFPADEMGEEKREARNSSIELANSIVELLQGVLGMEEGEPLPPDVVSDILAKYTFLDPTELQRWLRLSSIQKAAAKAASDSEGGDEDSGDGGDGGDMDLGGGDDSGGGGDNSGGGDEGGEPMPESEKYYQQVKNRLKEKSIKEREIHLKEISSRYKKSKNDIYLQFLKENNFQEWRDNVHGHSLIIPPIDQSSKYFETMKILQDKETVKSGRLQETYSASDMLKQTREQNLSLNEMLSQPLKEIEDIVAEE